MLKVSHLVLLIFTGLALKPLVFAIGCRFCCGDYYSAFAFHFCFHFGRGSAFIIDGFSSG